MVNFPRGRPVLYVLISTNYTYAKLQGARTCYTIRVTLHVAAGVVDTTVDCLAYRLR